MSHEGAQEGRDPDQPAQQEPQPDEQFTAPGIGDVPGRDHTALPLIPSSASQDHYSEPLIPW